MKVDISTRSMKVYVDDHFIISNNFPAGSLIGQKYFIIDWDYAWSGQSYYLVYVAIVSVYNNALSSSEVTAKFNAV